MSDVLRCDLCTNLEEKPAYNWYILTQEMHMGGAFINFNGRKVDSSPWHFCSLECLSVWTQEKVSERLGKKK